MVDFSSSVTISTLTRFNFSCEQRYAQFLFCVYTPVEVAVERIYPCKEWEDTCIPHLENYDKYMLPEIIDPLYTPIIFVVNCINCFAYLSCLMQL